MKKLSVAIAMMFAATVYAGEMSASYVRDAKVEKNGFRIEMPVGNLMGVKPVLGVTNIEDAYTRYSVGSNFQLTSLGRVSLAASASGVYQDSKTKTGKDGFGLTVGAKVTVPLAKTVDLVGSIDRFVGQSRVSNFNGSVGSIGVNVKF